MTIPPPIANAWQITLPSGIVAASYDWAWRHRQNLADHHRYVAPPLSWWGEWEVLVSDRGGVAWPIPPLCVVMTRPLEDYQSPLTGHLAAAILHAHHARSLYMTAATLRIVDARTFEATGRRLVWPPLPIPESVAALPEGPEMGLQELHEWLKKESGDLPPERFNQEGGIESCS